MDPSKPRVIADGLKVKLQSQNTVLQSFSYAVFPSMSQSSPVGWQYLVTKDKEAENIRLHELVKGEELGALLEGFKQSYAKATVLVNTEDSYEVAEGFVSGVKEVPFPLVVVRKSDGEEIMRCLERHTGDNVYARVDAENQNEPSQQAMATTAGVQSAVTHFSTRLVQKIRVAMGWKPMCVPKLLDAVERLMFSAEKTPIVMTGNSSKFMLVMNAFHNYERETKQNDVKDIGDVVKKLRKHYAAVLKSDFPFYLLLAYRMHRKRHKYNCDDVHQFITMCLLDFELKLMPKTIAHAILSFIHRGDFLVVFNPDGDEDRNCSVFHILEQACFELAEVSYKIKNSRIAEASNLSNGHRPLYRNFLYSRMLWVSLGMKFHEARKVTVTRNTQMKWRDYLLKFRHRIVLAPETITELRAGLRVGRLLELPFDLSCNYRHLGDLLASDNVIRPLQELRNCLVKVEGYVPSGTNLLTMLTEVRAVYDRFLKLPDINKLRVISSEGNLTSGLHWGIKFVDTVYIIFTKREMSQDDIDSEMQRWLELLLQLVDITAPNPEKHLGLFLHGTNTVLKKYRHVSQKFVSVRASHLIIHEEEECLEQAEIQDAEGIDEQDKEEDSEEFVQEIHDAISHDDTIDRKHAHSMFVGPPGSGKTSFMDRLLQRRKRMQCPSTGVCDSVVVIDIDEDNPSTFHSVTVMDGDVWNEVEYDVSLVKQMNVEDGSRLPPEQVQPKRTVKTSGLPTPSMASSTLAAENDTVTDTVAAGSETTTDAEKIGSMQAPPDFVAPGYTSRVSDRKIKEMVDAAVKKCGGYKKFRKFLKKSYSLYLRDTGGQVEFQEMIALLIFGPSIFFFVFRADLEFRSKFTVEYRMNEGVSTNRYTSSITTEEALLQCLASVYAMDASSKGGVKTHKPLVFIAGTHIDKLGPSAAEKIEKLNKHLDTLIVNSGFQDLVQYAGCGHQVMFAVDNTSETDEDLQPIRLKVHSLISGRNEFTVRYRISYLLFCLELQNLKCSVLSLDECKAMAAKFGIVGDQQVSHLLQFLHLRLGVIQYFDVPGLRHIVVKEPQVLFNKVTNLITRTFTCGALTTKEKRDFEKGIVTASVLENVISSDDKITCQDFLKLLVHLRIITPYPSTTPGGDQEERYFIPCVLNHVLESSKESVSTNILPLSVQFECKHCPKGLFGVLVTHLMTPESDGELGGMTSFTLLHDKIFKDQVSFKVHSTGVCDEISLEVHPSHLEINFFPESSEERDTSIKEVCSKVREIVSTSISKALANLHYNEGRLEPVMCLKCDHCSEPHPVKKGRQHYKIHCKSICKTERIPPQGRCWYNEDIDSSRSNTATAQGSARASIPSLADLTLLRWESDTGEICRFRLLRLISDQWWYGGVMLGLSTAELGNIKQKTDDDEQRFALIFTRWIERDGHPPRYPLSWDGVHELLCDLDRVSAAEELKLALDNASLN